MAGFSKLPTSDPILSRIQDQLVALLPGRPAQDPEIFVAVTDEDIPIGVGVRFTGVDTLPSGVLAPRVGRAYATSSATLPCVGVSVESVRRFQAIRVRWHGVLVEAPFAASGGTVGAPVYLQDSGQPGIAAGSVSQAIGRILDAQIGGRAWIG